MKAVISFVEYLFTGSLSLVWLWLLIPRENLSSLNSLNELLLIPFLYVIGMQMDFISMKLLKRFKKKIRNRHKHLKSKSYPSTTAAIISKNSDLGNEVSIRSTRDRIARGVLLNLIFISLCILITNKICTPDKYIYLTISLFLTVLSCFSWAEFQDQSTHFKYSSISILDEDQN